MIWRLMKNIKRVTAIEFAVVGGLVAMIAFAVFNMVNPKEVSNEQKEVFDDVRYVYDERTGLCFAHFDGYSRAGFAGVECTDKVKKQLVNPPKER